MNDYEKQALKVEEAKRRCKTVISKIEKLQNITNSSKQTLRKLALSELNFLSRFPLSNSSSPLSVNVGHLEAVVHILQQPFITGVSRVCKPIPVLRAEKNEKNDGLSCKGVYVDIVCTLKGRPVWILVSDRNPKYISWDHSHKTKGLKSRLEELLASAKASPALKPASIILYFSHGLGGFVLEKVCEEFEGCVSHLEFTSFEFDFLEDLEDDWVTVLKKSHREACVLEINFGEVVCNDLSLDVRPELREEHGGMSHSGDGFNSLITGLRSKDVNADNFQGGDDVINFDTTALIAMVSGISNGGAKRLLDTPESDLRRRFKGNYKFVMEQVMSEMEDPIHVELARNISGKRGIICSSVYSEFKELISMCGGSNEKLRAQQLLNCLIVVPDSPSERMMGLPTTRKLALKNKVVFGTGDYWHAPTFTANMAFVRAVSQTGMPLSTIQHRPRALTGD